MSFKEKNFFGFFKRAKTKDFMKYGIFSFYKLFVKKSRTETSHSLKFEMDRKGFSLVTALVASGLIGTLAVLIMKQVDFSIQRIVPK